MLFVRCEVFLMTLMELNQYHIKRSIYPVHYVYVFHAMASTHMMCKAGAYDYYDSLLCVGPHQIAEIRKYEELYGVPRKQLIKAGYYRLERIYSAYRKYVANAPGVPQKLTILIAPSWGPKNVLESCGESLVELLLNNGYDVIVRPHPETIRRSRQLIDALANRFGRHQNFTLEESVATDDSLIESDILICDCSGVALEYAFGTERPVLFLDVPYKIQNKNYKELNIEPLELLVRSEIGIVVSPERLESIPEVIMKLIDKQMEYKKKIIQLREKYVYNCGESSRIGAEHVIGLLQSSHMHIENSSAGDTGLVDQEERKSS